MVRNVRTNASRQIAPRPSAIARTARVSLSGGGCRLLCALRRFLAALGRLGAELLREPLHAAFRVDQLLLAREERMAVRADFEMQLFFGRSGLPRRAARAAGID